MPLFKDYCVFSFPLGLLLLFGLLSPKPGQLFKKYPSYILNIYVAFTCCNILINDTGHVINNYDLTNVNVKSFFYMFFYVVTMTCVGLLLYKMHKEYNLYAHLNDITSTCNSSLKKNYTMLIYLSYILILLDVCYYTYYCFTIFKYKVEVMIFTVKITGEAVTEFLRVLHVWAIISSWMCVLCTSLLLCIICLVISESYDGLTSVLKERIGKNRCLTDEAFSEATERFYELTGLVRKVDDMFSDIVGVTFCLSLVILCCAIYGTIIKSGTVEGWSIPLVMSLTIIYMLLISAPTLHSRVSLNSISYITGYFDDYQGVQRGGPPTEVNNRISIKNANYIKSTLVSFLKVCLYNCCTNAPFYQI